VSEKIAHARARTK